MDPVKSRRRSGGTPTVTEQREHSQMYIEMYMEMKWIVSFGWGNTKKDYRLLCLTIFTRAFAKYHVLHINYEMVSGVHFY